METGLLSSLGVCSEPGTAQNHGWGGGPQGLAQMIVAPTTQLRAWPPGRQAASVQVSWHLDSTQPMLFP